MHAHWIRTMIASIALAILLRVGLGVPFMTTFVGIAIIYLTHIVYGRLGTGVTVVVGWMRNALNVLGGMVIFLALRFLVAKLVGLYPIDTYNTVNDSGGFQWILPGHDISTYILWEVMFALVAGGLSVAWAQGKKRGFVGGIFGFSLLVLSVQIALPEFAGSFQSRPELAHTLVEKGVVGTAWDGTWTILFGKSKSSNHPQYSPQAQQQEVASESETRTCDLSSHPVKVWISGGAWQAEGDVTILNPAGNPLVTGLLDNGYNKSGDYTFSPRKDDSVKITKPGETGWPAECK